MQFAVVCMIVISDGHDMSATVVSVLVISLLDCCNVILTAWSHSSTASLQHVMNSAGRLVLGLRLCNHVSEWLCYTHSMITFVYCSITACHEFCWSVGVGPSAM